VHAMDQTYQIYKNKLKLIPRFGFTSRHLATTDACTNSTSSRSTDLHTDPLCLHHLGSLDVYSPLVSDDLFWSEKRQGKPLLSSPGQLLGTVISGTL
jgi:hypothetical protein